MYVDDLYRKNNIASNMMNLFNIMFFENYYNELKDKDYVVLSASGICLDIAKKNLTGVVLSESFCSPLIWKEDCSVSPIQNSLNLIHKNYDNKKDFSLIINSIKEKKNINLSIKNKIKHN